MLLETKIDFTTSQGCSVIFLGGLQAAKRQRMKIPVIVGTPESLYRRIENNGPPLNNVPHLQNLRFCGVNNVPHRF